MGGSHHTAIAIMTYVIDEAREERAIQQKFDELITACRNIRPLSPQEESEIFRAFSLAKKAHAGTRRKSGEPYIFHPLEVALIAVRDVGLGPVGVICALLHDVVEDTDISLANIRTIFGDRVATIVDGVTKIEDVLESQQSESKQAENYRKILLSMCNDVYVIFLKLCDRLHNMRTLGSMRDTKKLAISSETQYLYIPLAHRLGLYNIKTELEELVMKYTNPEQYERIHALIRQTAGTELQLKECFTKPIRQMLDEKGYHYTIKTRVKSAYSCWKKMERKGVGFEEIYDLYAMRIILDVPPEKEKEECFKVYALISSKFPPNPMRFRDWITIPKNNGYESLQTTVMTPIGRWVEVQIRTTRMDNIAEKGMAAHFLYKEAHPEAQLDSNPVEDWLQQIRATLENSEKSALDLVEEFKETLYTNEIYLFTPKGENITLPAHSTVLDFAFSIHSDLGLHCIGAKVNSKVVPIGYGLHSGEQVQVLTSRRTIPSEEWLQYAHTSRAKEKIKDWLRDQKKSYLDEGQQRLKNYCQKLHIRFTPTIVATIKHHFALTSEVDLYYQLASGTITEEQVSQCLGKARPQPMLFFLEPFKKVFGLTDTEIEKNTSATSATAQMQAVANITEASPLNILLDSEFENFETCAAPCCKPVPGDAVVGIISNNKVMVHRTNCKIAMDEMASHENNIVRAKWRSGEQVSLLTGIALTAIDRPGLLQEITLVISSELELNMRAITLEASEGIGRGIIMLYVNDVDSLNNLINKLRSIDGIEDVRRI